MKGNIVKKHRPGDFELIAIGETTEEVNTINITTDNDCNPFELCDMITIYTMSPKSTNSVDSSLSYYFNASFMQQTPANAISTSGSRYHRLIGIYSGKRWDSYCYSVANTADNGTIVSRDRNGQTTEKTVNRIKMYLYNSELVLPIGFKYEIYGRRVKNANS